MELHEIKNHQKHPNRENLPMLHIIQQVFTILFNQTNESYSSMSVSKSFYFLLLKHT